MLVVSLLSQTLQAVSYPFSTDLGLLAIRITGWRSTFAQVFVRSVLGQCCDKTFFLIVALTGWDNIEGLREYHGAPLDRCSVCVAAILGLSLRVYNLTLDKNPQRWATFWEFFAAFITMMLAVNTRGLELRKLEEKVQTQFKSVSAARNPSSSAAATADEQWSDVRLPSQHDGTWATDGRQTPARMGFTESWATDFKKLQSQGQAWNSEQALQADEDGGSEPLVQEKGGQPSYGSTPAAATSTAAAQDMGWMLFRAFFNFSFTAVVVYAMEAEDKMMLVLQPASLEAEDMRTFRMGAILGTTLAACIAVVVGLAMEYALVRERYLFALSLLFSSLSLVCLTQGLGHALPGYLVEQQQQQQQK
mmetsp:Transcript_73089/g.174155  ORF Transcript_73089/g.174155 Transcript_73089/m.174155 type:complete len:362 (+) Transcript_73089:214-1299(+)